MKMRLLENVNIENGVCFLSDIDNTFDKIYLAVRKKENRFYADSEISILPTVSTANRYFKEWELRKIACERFIEYFQSIDHSKNTLDIGCGTGWFTALLANNCADEVYGIDINKFEIEQAARVFKLQNLYFIYGNLLDDIFHEKSFDIITLNASAQYFKDFNYLLNKLLSILTDNGEIHILDTPFYKSIELAGARERSVRYYRSLGYMEMAKYYFHHSYEKLEKFNSAILFNPNSFIVRIRKMFKKNDSPFPWIKIVK